MRQIGKILAFYTINDIPSNFYPADFRIHRKYFNCVEQFLHYTKAMCFSDDYHAKLIMQVRDPMMMKRFGRQVTPYDEKIWSSNRFKWYKQGLIARYEQNPLHYNWLMDTGDLTLVEASPVDAIWGVRLAEDDDRIADPTQWQGLNLCGQGHMDVREHFKQHPPPF